MRYRMCEYPKGLVYWIHIYTYVWVWTWHTIHVGTPFYVRSTDAAVETWNTVNCANGRMKLDFENAIKASKNEVIKHSRKRRVKKNCLTHFYANFCGLVSLNLDKFNKPCFFGYIQRIPPICTSLDVSWAIYCKGNKF